MKSPKQTARFTGLLGIIVLASGSFAHSVTSQLINPDDFVVTAEQIIASESLFRLGFVSGLLMEIVFIFYAFLLFQLLKGVHKSAANLMFILALLPVPIFLLNQLHYFAVLLLVETQQLAQIPFYVSLHKHGGLIVSIFFGLWLLPLGYLVYKSIFLPKILGVFLMIGCFGYLIGFIQGFLFPGTEATLWTNPALIVTHISEMLLMLWLCFIGVNTEVWKTKNRSLDA